MPICIYIYICMIIVVKDPSSDFATNARNGSNLLREVREKRDMMKMRKRYIYTLILHYYMYSTTLHCTCNIQILVQLYIYTIMLYMYVYGTQVLGAGRVPHGRRDGHCQAPGRGRRRQDEGCTSRSSSSRRSQRRRR